MKIIESSQRNVEETARNPWDMETNLQYIDKRLAYHVYVNKHTNTRAEYKPKRSKHTDTCRLPLWILWRQQGKYLCFESITSHIFIFLSPCCYNFLPCQTNQNAKTKRRLKEQLRFSTVRFTNAFLLQTGSVWGDMTCVCVFVDLCAVCVLRVPLCWFSCPRKQYSSFCLNCI